MVSYLQYRETENEVIVTDICLQEGQTDVVVPRTKDDDGIDDGLVELDEINHKENDPSCDCGCDHDNFEELETYVATQPDDENGNFSEL